MSKSLIVVIPAYNEELYLVRALAAITNQSVPRNLYEVVVVDNGSTDHTADIARMFGVTVLSQKIKGYSLTLKAGFDYALRQGAEWLAVTDADSQVDHRWIETILKKSIQKEVVGLTGPVKFYDVSRAASWFSDLSYQGFVHLLKMFAGFVQFSGQNSAFRAEAYQTVGGIDLKYTMSPDVYLSKRLNKVGQIKFVRSMKVQTSPRRFKHQFFKGLWGYARGTLSVLRGKTNAIKWDDVR